MNELKELQQEQTPPQDIHRCDILGMKFQYSLWRDFKCPAVNGCGFEYKVKVE